MSNWKPTETPDYYPYFPKIWIPRKNYTAAAQEGEEVELETRALEFRKSKGEKSTIKSVRILFNHSTIQSFIQGNTVYCLSSYQINSRDSDIAIPFIAIIHHS